MNDPVKFGPDSPLPFAPISQGMMDHNLTGSWRYLIPRYENKVPPCRWGCPAAEPVDAVMALVEQGNLEEAARRILDESPFPGICGRVCLHPCEQACNREGLDRSLAIQLIERFVADETAPLDLLPPVFRKDGYRVAVIGAGPAGMSAAYFLARLGHRVTIFEAEKDLGGILRYGIPPYRLPRAVLDREIRRILSLGVFVEPGVRVGQDLPWAEMERFEACFLSTGLGRSRPLRVPGEEAENVEAGLDFLRRSTDQAPEHPGKRVVVVGGGNTAIDVVRTAIRAGSAEVTLLYRRSREEMPALSGEVEEALREGVKMEFFTSPTRLFADENGRVVAVETVRTQPGEPDESGRRYPVPVPGTERITEADRVVTALGEEMHPSALPDRATLVRENGFTRVLGVGATPFFAGGDLTNDLKSVVTAVASGKGAALAIDSALHGDRQDWDALRVAGGGISFARYTGGLESGRNEVVSLDRINMDYFGYMERERTPRLTVPERAGNFREVNLGFTEGSARAEASRCLRCGTCTACNNCFVFCPDIAVIKCPDGTFSIRSEYCKGCGICVTECPHGAMEMEIEQSGQVAGERIHDEGGLPGRETAMR